MKTPWKKANWYYEMQILMIVFMWQHDMSYKSHSKDGIRLGRLYIWYDTAWKSHGIANKLDDFFYDLFKNTDKFKRTSSKLVLVKINAKNMFQRWTNENRVELVKFLKIFAVVSILAGILLISVLLLYDHYYIYVRYILPSHELVPLRKIPLGRWRIVT